MFLRFAHGLATSACVGVTTLGVAGLLPAADPATPAIQSVASAKPAHKTVKPVPTTVLTEKSASGLPCNAILMRAPESLVATNVVSHCIVLVDTSASQVGEHRAHSQKIVSEVLASLPQSALVQLYAVDLRADALMSGFASPAAPETLAALRALEERLPLGATDLPGALRSTLAALPQDQSAAVLYVGDGVSSADATSKEEWAQLAGAFRDRHVAIHSYGVGPQVNQHVLGVLAHQTGGTNQRDLLRAKDEPVAQRLADALVQTAWYPTAWGAESAELPLLPKQPLPLRADRDTVLLTTGSLPAGAHLSVIDGATAVQFDLSAPVARPGLNFLPAFADRVRVEGELANSLAGQGQLEAAQDDFNRHIENLVLAGEAALGRRDAAQAAQVARLVTQLDPQNVAGRALNRQVQPVRPVARQLGAAQTGADGLPPEDAQEVLEDNFGAKAADALMSDEAAVPTGNEPTPPEPGNVDSVETVPADDLLPRTEPGTNQGLIAEREQLIQVRTQKLVQQVNDTVQASRTAPPDVGLEELKRLLTSVRSAIDVSPEARDSLERVLGSEILRLQVAQDDVERRTIREQERIAQTEARERLADALAVQEDRLATLIDRVRALMEDGRRGDEVAYGEAEQVARVAVNLRPGEGTSAAALFGAEAALQLQRTFRQRSRRADEFLETLYQVEESHVPFPDEPPVRFPPAEVWKSLTERRRKYRSVDLRKNRPNEDRIYSELDKPTEVDFADTPLRDAIEFIEDQHDIDIVLDEPAIMEEGAATDAPVSLSLSGITLRSVLRLMLEPENLTYIVKDEVMQITTKAKADEEGSQVVRVYPVADLVVPITSGGGFGGAGVVGQGGLGGGMGGGMGGMGGFGGGGMGGMGGGMQGGGGFFSIPALPAEGPVAPKKKAQ